MKYLVMPTDPALPVVRIPVCERCEAFHQPPSPGCLERHGAADPREVLRQLCKVAGHVLVDRGASLSHCLRCARPRAQVVV